VEIRYVYPKSAAERAKLERGDRIMKVGPRQTGPAPKLPKGPLPPGVEPPGPKAFSGRDQFMALMQNYRSGASLTLEVKRKGGKTETVDVVLGQFTDDVPAELPAESTKEKALVAPKPVGPDAPPKKDEGKKDEVKKDEPKKDEAKKDEAKKDDKEKPKTGMQKIEGAGSNNRKFWVFIPETYDPNVAHGLIVWLHPAERGGGRDADDMIRIWEPYLEKYNFIMMGPAAAAPSGWVAGEAEGVLEDVRWVRARYTIDNKRIVAHGLGVGGQMAYYLGFNQRDVIRGVVPVGAVLASNPKDPDPAKRVEFLVIGGAKDPLVGQIKEGPKKLAEKKYRAQYREMAITGKEYVNDDPPVFGEMVRWMETLDKQ
jgi:predicted esterase